MTKREEELCEALWSVLHQLSTDSDLDDCVSAPDKYDYLEAMVRRVLGDYLP